MNKPTLYLSYSYLDKPIADNIASRIKEITFFKIDVIKYFQTPHHDSFKGFIRALNSDDYVLCIVSGSYLESYSCMFEIGEIIKTPELASKLLFLVVNNKARKYYNDRNSCNPVSFSTARSNKHIKFWKHEYEHMLSVVNSQYPNSTPPSALSEKLITTKTISEFYINDLLLFIDKYKENTLSKLILEDFQSIITRMLPSPPKHQTLKPIQLWFLDVIQTNAPTIRRTFNYLLHPWNFLLWFLLRFLQRKHHGALFAAPYDSDISPKDNSPDTRFPTPYADQEECILMKDGSTYIGKRKAGKRNGYGISRYPDGTSYNGFWLDDKRNGYGTEIYADKSVYVGEWQDDKRHGHGKLTDSNSIIYEGKWENDKRHGHGIIIYPDGTTYECEWQDGKQVAIP